MLVNKKTVSVVVPIYNEISTISEVVERVRAVFSQIDEYEYEIVFFDDGSTDGTRNELEKLCSENRDIKCVFYSKNFGYTKNTFYCMQQAKGDCAIIVHSDLQNPPELIPQFLKKWENGAQVVQGVKNKSRENKFVYFIRTLVYFVFIKIFGMNITAHATEFELFDKSFIDILKKIKTNNPFLRGIVSEYASSIEYVYYTQDARKKGKSKFNINKYYDFAICGITQYSRKLPRKIIAISIAFLIVLIVEFFAIFIPYSSGLTAVELSNSILLRCLLAGICLLAVIISIVFEFITTIKDNSVVKPFIIEEKRINY